MTKEACPSFWYDHVAHHWHTCEHPAGHEGDHHCADHTLSEES